MATTASKQLIVVVEGTAALGPFWQTIISDYLDKIIRSFCGNDPNGQKPSVSAVELSLVVFNAHGPYSACLVRRSGWTRDIDMFYQWLSSIQFSGGGFNDAAVAEGLSEALMMFSPPPKASQAQKNAGVQRHCILVASSNPYPLPTPVYRPQLQNTEQSDAEDPTDSHLSDAETLAKSFPQCSISLSIICPKQLAKLRAIFNSGKPPNPRAVDLPVDSVKNPHFMVLISENFIEACAAVSGTPITNFSTAQPIKVDATPVTSIVTPASTSIPTDPMDINIDIFEDTDEEVENERIARQRKDGRKREADFFHQDFIYGGSGMDQKLIVCNGQIYSCTDKSTGTLWVGVHGLNSICVVTMTGDLDVTRVLEHLKFLSVESVLRQFRRTVISELEGLAMRSKKLVGQRIWKPFGVVSMTHEFCTLHDSSGQEASNDEDQENNLTFIPEKAENEQISKAQLREMVRRIIWKDDCYSKMHSLLSIFVSKEVRSIECIQNEMVKTLFTVNKFLKASKELLITEMEAITVDEIRKAGDAEYHPLYAIMFLQGILKPLVLEKSYNIALAGYDVIEATNFLKEKMEASTLDETVKTAISAFQILLQKNFKAEDIGVSVMDPDYAVPAKESAYKDIYVKHLETSEIKEYLAAINEPSSRSSLIESSSSKPQSRKRKEVNYLEEGQAFH